VDCICPAEYSDKPIKPMESPMRGWLKNLTKSLALIRYLLLYLRWCRQPSLYSCQKM
jgi:hypothetical protein